jgi:toxin ParE1/3/4
LLSLRLSAAAQADMLGILKRSAERFGADARQRYEMLLSAGLNELTADPVRRGSAPRPELGNGVRGYDLRFRKPADQSPDVVRNPRHLLLYRLSADHALEVGRILHGAMDLPRHVVFEP